MLPLLLVLGAAAPPAARPPAAVEMPSVAVLRIEPRNNVAQDTARIVADAVASNIKKTNRFSRVVTTADIEATLSLENQRQLLDCNASSCMAEMAGSLGVDYLVTGSLGKLGSMYVLNARMLSARTALANGTSTRTVPTSSEAQLLDAAKEIADELVGTLPSGEARAPAAKAPPPKPVVTPLPGVKGPQADPAPAPVAVVTSPRPAPAPSPAEAPAPKTEEPAAVTAAEPAASGVSSKRIALGSLAAASGVAAVALGLLAAVVGAGVASVFYVYVQVPGTRLGAHETEFWTGWSAGLGAAVVLALLGVAGVGVLGISAIAAVLSN